MPSSMRKRTESGTGRSRNAPDLGIQGLGDLAHRGLGQPEPEQLLGQALEAAGGHASEEQPADEGVDVGLAAAPPVDDLQVVAAVGEAWDPQLHVAPGGLEAPTVAAAAVAVAGVGALVCRRAELLGSPGLKELLNELPDQSRDPLRDVVPEQPGEIRDHLEGAPRILLRRLLPCYFRHRAPPPVDLPINVECGALSTPAEDWTPLAG
jgi:hypothetical protein